MIRLSSRRSCRAAVFLTTFSMVVHVTLAFLHSSDVPSSSLLCHTSKSCLERTRLNPNFSIHRKESSVQHHRLISHSSLSSSSNDSNHQQQQQDLSPNTSTSDDTNDDDDEEVNTGASIPNLTTSLVKSIVGAGILGLPAGVSYLGDTPLQALPSAVILIALAGGMNAYFFSLLGQVCVWTGATSYRDAWDKTVGSQYSRAVAITVTLKTLLSCLAYSIILADSFASLAATAGLESIDRTRALLGVTVTALLPLCLLKDLSQLAPFSFLGIMGIGFTASVIVLRAMDGSYVAPDGPFVQSLDFTLQPWFGNAQELVPNAQGVVLVCTLATAFVAHYNAPRFHKELRDSTMPRFNQVVFSSYAIAVLAFVVVAIAGFSTWGAHAQAMILNNYSDTDPLAATSRAALAAAIVLSYPLPFVGLRDGVLDCFEIENRSEELQSLVSVGILGVITAVAMSIRDLGLVLAVGGGTFSTAVSSVFPALMYRAAVKERNDTTPESDKLSTHDEDDALLPLVLMSLSMAIGVTGVTISLNKAFHFL